MTFFNKKEEVIAIELTQFGKLKLAVGDFKPEYYAFFDDDIIYDNSYTGMTEEQNDIKERIKTTPRTKPQYLFRGIESENQILLEQVEDLREQEADIEELQKKIRRATNPIKDRYYSEIPPIGTAEVANRYAPMLKVNYLSGDHLKSVVTGSEDTSGILKTVGNVYSVPELNSTIEYQTKLLAASDAGEFNLYPDEDIIFGTGVSIDGVNFALVLEEQEFLLSIEEDNIGPSIMKNFDIEVAVETISGSNEFKRLMFSDKPERPLVENGLLREENYATNGLEEELERDYRSLLTINNNYVSYYVDITFDAEIDSNVLCRHVGTTRIKSTYTDLRLECPDVKEPLIKRNIYTPDNYEDFCSD